MAHLKDSKDTNLVVATVLFIAVLVAVSLVVDAWAGKTVHPEQAYTSEKEDLDVVSFTFATNNMVNVIIENNGTATSIIAEVWINNEQQTFTTNSTLIHPKDYAFISIRYVYANDTAGNWVNVQYTYFTADTTDSSELISSHGRFSSGDANETRTGLTPEGVTAGIIFGSLLILFSSSFLIIGLNKRRYSSSD